jgi:D-arabinose 1-dehydrogenase-like Zn-dependent alcohol dehydrogenase
MKALVVESKGVTRLREIGDPLPGREEVKVRVKRAALCYRDLLQLRGFYPRMKYPVILGHEVVGQVVEVGEGVKRLEPGDVVVSMTFIPDWSCDRCRAGEENSCPNSRLYAQEVDGFFAEEAIIKESTAVKVPEGVSLEGAVVVPCVVGMILGGLRRVGLKGGERVLVTGAGGGVGVHAIQVAKALGAWVAAATGSQEKERYLSGLADRVVVGESFSEEVRRSGEVDVVVEAVGSPTLQESLKSLRNGGRVLLVGNVEPSSPFQLRIGYVILKNLKLIGHVGSTKADLIQGLHMVKEGKVKPIVQRTVGLGEVLEALNSMGAWKGVGKVLVSF